MSHNFYNNGGQLNQPLQNNFQTQSFTSSQKHYHPLSSDKICCFKHVIELNNFFKQQSRFTEAGDALIKYFSRPNSISLILNDYSVGLDQIRSLFLLCNEHASRYTVSGDLERAQTLLEKAQQLSHDMPLQLKATLYSNISCYYEKTNDDQTALMYLNQAMTAESQLQQQNTESTPTSNSNFSTLGGGSNSSNNQDVVGQAISHNNLAVLELKALNFQAAFKASKNAVMTLEPKLFADIKQAQQAGIDLKQDKPFLDKLQVLLISYFNLGVSQTKVGNIQYARTVFEHGFKMGKKYMGEEHYFTQRFARRINKPMGTGSNVNRNPSPQRSIKQQDSSVGNGQYQQIQQRNTFIGPRASTGYGTVQNNDESDVIVDINTGANIYQRPQSQLQSHSQQPQQQQMKVITKGENRKIITSLPTHNAQQQFQLNKDVSGVSVLDSAHSSQNSHSNQQQQQQLFGGNTNNTAGSTFFNSGQHRQESRKKSELMQMVKDSQELDQANNNIIGSLSNINQQQPSQHQNMLTQHEQSIETNYKQQEDIIQKQKQELMKQLEDEFKAKQEQLQKQQEQESKKIQDLLLNLTQNQTDLSKKWEEFQKKQEDFEKKIALEKTELTMERQRILQENQKVEEEKLKQLEKQKQEESKLQMEKQKLQQQAEQEQKMKQQQLQNEIERRQQELLQQEKEKQQREHQEMMKNMQLQQEKYNEMQKQMEMMAKQQREMEEMKKQMQMQQEKLEREKQELEKQKLAKQQTSNKADLNFNQQMAETFSKQQQQQLQQQLQNPPIKISIQEKPKEETKSLQIPSDNAGGASDNDGSYNHPFIRQTSKVSNTQQYNVLAKPEDIKDDQRKTLERLQSQSKLIKDVRKSGGSNIQNEPISASVTTNPFIQHQQPQIKQQNNAIISGSGKIANAQQNIQVIQEEIKIPDTPKTLSGDHKQGSGGAPAISDVSSIKESTKNGNHNINDPIYTFTMEQLNEIIEEDIKLYDASIILTNEIVGAQFKVPKIVSQIIYCDGLYYKMYCEGCLGKDGKPIFKMHGICEDPKIQVMDEELIFFEMRSILNLIIVKDVLPPFLPIKNIRTFTDICKYFIFPFLLTTAENKIDENLTPDSNNNHSQSQAPPPSASQSNRALNTSSNERYIEIWGRSPGLLSQPTQIMILKNLCNVSLHYASDRYFKLAITSLDQESANSLYLDLYFDETSFAKYFNELDPADFKLKDGTSIPTKEGEIKLPSIKIIDKEFLFEIEGALKAFETYLYNEFGNEVQFPYVVYERTGLIYQLRIKDEGNLQELWCVKDDQKAQNFEIICKTLYELRIKKHCIQQVERKMTIDYNQIWVIFGVPLGNQNPLKDPSSKKDDPTQLAVDRSQHIMMAALFLQTTFLHMPTMELNKGDLEDSDFEEEVNIAQKKIECVMHIRKLLDINGEKMPLTIQLLGYDNNTYLGIKVTAYNPALIKETGVFLTVNQKYWELTQEQKQNIPKKKTMKTEILLDHYHIPDLLKRNGFLIIFNNLSIKKNEKTVKWKGPYGEAHIDVFESYFTRGSSSH